MPKKTKKSKKPKIEEPAFLKDYSGDHAKVYNRDASRDKKQERRPISAVELTFEKERRNSIVFIRAFHTLIDFLRDGLPGGDFMAFLVFAVLAGAILSAPIVILWAWSDPSAFDFSMGGDRTKKDDTSLHLLQVVVVITVLVIPIISAVLLRLRYIARRSMRGK